MRHRRSVRSIIAASAALALVLAACSPGSSDEGDSDGNTQTTQQASEDAGGDNSEEASEPDASEEDGEDAEPSDAEGDEPSGDMVSLKVGQPNPGAGYMELYSCLDNDIFAKHGLDISLEVINSSSQTLAALQSGSVDIAPGSATAASAGIVQGLDLKFIAVPHPTYYYEMWASPDVKVLEDLKGKKVALSSPGSGGDDSVTDMLDALGWPQDAVERVYVGSAAAEVTALQQGAVDALVTQPPTGTRSAEFGAHRLWDTARYDGASNSFYVSGSFLEKNREALLRFVKAETECLAFIHDPKNSESVIDSIMKHVKMEDDERYLAEYSYLYMVPTFPKVPRVSVPLIQSAIDRVAEREGVEAPSAEDYVASDLVDEMIESGFVDDLYPYGW